MSRERVEHTLRAVTLFLAEHREAFCEVLPSVGSPSNHRTWRGRQRCSRPLMSRTLDCQLQRGVEMLPSLASLCTCRVPRHPSRNACGRSASEVEVTLRVTDGHTLSHLRLGRCRKMGLAASEALINSDLPGLKLVSKGKVRDIYETSDPNRLLFVASDRISAYDVIMRNVRELHTPPGVG